MRRFCCSLPHVCEPAAFHRQRNAEINIGNACRRCRGRPGHHLGQQKYAVRVQVDPDLLRSAASGLMRCSAPWPQRARTRRSARSAGRKRPRPCRLIRCDHRGWLRSTDHRLPHGAPGAAARRRRSVDSVQNDKSGELVQRHARGDGRDLPPGRCQYVEVVDQIKALVPAFRRRSSRRHRAPTCATTAPPRSAPRSPTSSTPRSRWCCRAGHFSCRAAAYPPRSIPALALPVSIIGTFAAMYLLATASTTSR